MPVALAVRISDQPTFHVQLLLSYFIPIPLKIEDFLQFMQGFEDTLNIVEKDESKKETLKCIFFYVGLVVLEKNLVNGKVDVPSFRGSFMYYTLVLSV